MSGKTAKKAEPKRSSKIDEVIALLSRAEGATLEELVTATSWQSHSARAALTGLRKKGHAITREKIDGTSRYRITSGDAQ
jgi:hypothetical protein